MTYTYRGIANLPDDTDDAAIDVVEKKLIDGLRAGRTALAFSSAHTIALTDIGELLTLTGTWNLKVPKNSVVAVPFSPVTILELQNISSGTITLVPVDGTVTILGPSLTLKAYEGGTLSKIDTNLWIFVKGAAEIDPLTVLTEAVQTLKNKTMSGADNTFSAIPQSAITSLVSALAALAPKASPTFTGVVTAVSPASGSGSVGVRQIYISTSSTPSGGADGDLWIQYTP